MPKILIIEDEASIRRVLVKILTEENTKYEHCLLGEQTNVSCSQKNKINLEKKKKKIERRKKYGWQPCSKKKKKKK